MEKFSGVQRRFTKVFSFQNVSFFDDYAHHPTEIVEVLDGVKKVYKNEEIIWVNVGVYHVWLFIMLLYYDRCYFILYIYTYIYLDKLM